MQTMPEVIFFIESGEKSFLPVNRDKCILAIFTNLNIAFAQKMEFILFRKCIAKMFCEIIGKLTQSRIDVVCFININQ